MGMVVLSHLHNYCLALDPQCVNQNLPIRPLCDDVWHPGHLISEIHHLIPCGSAGRATISPWKIQPPGSSKQPSTTEQLPRGHDLGNTWNAPGGCSGRLLLPLPAPYPRRMLRDTRGSTIRRPRTHIGVGVGVLMLLNAAICTIVLTFLNYKSPLAGIYRGNL